MFKLCLQLTALALLIATASAAARKKKGPKTELDITEEVLAKANPLVRPKSGENGTTTVKFGFSPMYLELTSAGLLKGRGYYKKGWTDERLKWNAVDLKGVAESLHVDPSRIWGPDVMMYHKLHNEPHLYGPEATAGGSARAQIFSGGSVFHAPEQDILTACSGANLRDMWGIHTCELKFSSWSYPGTELALELYDGKEIDLTDYSEQSPLKIRSSKLKVEVDYYECCPEPFYSIKLEMKVQRRFALEPLEMTFNPKLA